MASPLLSLPNELLYEVASHLPSTELKSNRQTQAASPSDLASFTMICKDVRAATLSILFHTVCVSSANRLVALAGAPESLLRLVRYAISFHLFYYK